MNHWKPRVGQPWKPRIYRRWDGKTGRFVWATTTPPHHSDGNHHRLYLAICFCKAMNREVKHV